MLLPFSGLTECSCVFAIIFYKFKVSVCFFGNSTKPQNVSGKQTKNDEKKTSMKFLLYFSISILSFLGFGQDIKTCETKLNLSFDIIQFYANSDDKIKFEENYIDNSNTNFEKMLLDFTKSQPKTLIHKFLNLEKKGLKISSSKDGFFRIYSWDTESGGTMRSFRNVFQYMDSKKIHSENLIDKDEYGESMFTYEIIDQVISKKKTYYVVKCIFIGSSALSYHKIKIFSIENDKLNENAKLIKTSTGIKNELGYEIDFSSSVNREPNSVEMDFAWINYNKINKIITIPLITSEGKLTKRKITYKFNGEYFIKI